MNFAKKYVIKSIKPPLPNNKIVPNIIKEALADGRINEDKRGGCDNWSFDNGKKPFDCGGNPKSKGSYAFSLGDENGIGYSEDTYCEECTIKMLKGR